MSNAAEQAKLEGIGSQIVRLLAGQLVYPCVLLTYTDVRRLRVVSDLLAQRFDWPELSIGQRVSAALLGVAPRRWPRLAGQAMVDAVDSLAPGPILCGDIDLLFEPALELDPLRLLRETSRLASLVVLWPGAYRERVLGYAVPEHAHYRTWRQTDLCAGCVIPL